MTNLTPQQLKQLIESDTEASEHYAAGRHAACAARCSVIAPTIRVQVAADTIQREASLSGSWAKIVLARESTATPVELKGVCITLLDWVDKGRTIDFDLPQVQGMLAALVAANIVPQSEADALNASASVPQTFTTDDIQQAMSI